MLTFQENPKKKTSKKKRKNIKEKENTSII